MFNKENRIKISNAARPLDNTLNFLEHRCFQLLQGFHPERVMKAEGYMNCWVIFDKDKNVFIPTEFCHMCGVKLE